MSPVVQFAIQILEALPTVIKMTTEAAKFIRDSISALKAMQLEGRDPTDEEWEALNATIERLRAERPPLPPAAQ